MLLPSSMRINDPFSMKLEKVETPPAPVKLTSQQEFEHLNHDDPAHPTGRRLFFEGHADAELAEIWRAANRTISKPVRHVEAAKIGPQGFFGMDFAGPEIRAMEYQRALQRALTTCDPPVVVNAELPARDALVGAGIRAIKEFELAEKILSKWD